MSPAVCRPVAASSVGSWWQGTPGEMFRHCTSSAGRASAMHHAAVEAATTGFLLVADTQGKRILTPGACLLSLCRPQPGPLVLLCQDNSAMWEVRGSRLRSGTAGTQGHGPRELSPASALSPAPLQAPIPSLGSCSVSVSWEASGQTLLH